MTAHAFTVSQFMAESPKTRRCTCALIAYLILQLCSATRQNPLRNEKIGDLVQPFGPPMKNEAKDRLSSWLERVLVFWEILLDAWGRRAPASLWINAFSCFHLLKSMSFSKPDVYMNFRHMRLFLFTKQHGTFHHTRESCLLFILLHDLTLSVSLTLFLIVSTRSLPCQSVYVCVWECVRVWFESVPGLSD